VAYTLTVLLLLPSLLLPLLLLLLQVIMPAGFSAACRKRPDCSTGPDIRVISSYFSPASRSVPVVMAVVANATHLLAEDPAVNTKVISGKRCFNTCMLLGLQALVLVWVCAVLWEGVCCHHGYGG
jgi:hypothetical protein